MVAGVARSLRFLRFSSTKPFYTTTPIFYVNANPHLGHLYSSLLCDTRNRWEKLKPGAKTFFTTGTDEHGLKIQAVAEAQGIHPKELTDRVSENFKKLATDLNIEYDRFIRTTDPDHVSAVQYYWNTMQEKGLLYQGLHSGWYSISDETFYPESQIEEHDGKMISKETRNVVVFQEETNYFFRLSNFQEQLIEYLESNSDFIIPHSRYLSLLNELKENKLEDLSVSRPSSRLTWGIEVPNDETQKVYVWFDALINYITSCGYPSDAFFSGATADGANPWPGTHVIGKDIIRFHCIYWPIFLMAANIAVPKQVVVHSHWLSDGFKMSKSLGNVVDPQSTADYYGKDPLRFFLMEYSNLENDCNYREEQFHFTREKLIGKYANLITRCGGNAFNIVESLKDYESGEYKNIDGLLDSRALNSEVPEIKQIRDNLVLLTNSLFETMDKKMEQFDQQRAISEWWNIVESANQLFQLGQPWLYAKELKNEQISPERKKAYTTLRNYYTFIAAEVSRVSSILISPIIPELSNQILDRLNVDKSRRNAAFCKIGSDLTYGLGANDKSHKVPISRVPMRE
ncbi:methionine--tRNA ligase, mitochondrial [[Candida] railenensis]|uniref:Probable methionine--tRNA ligase, mitochondrial n=1 Tax=[Candida] railenensis TaxID=45579 RepID=A0A9P0VZG3_9ASCO|nr:methionine--tRNA ligase, mitochondrial [[Candida] railenensis]